MSNLTLIYDRYYNEILHFVHSKIQNKHTSEEIVQDTFVRACEHKDTVIHLSEEKKKAWLLTVAKNRCIDYWRKKKREKEKVVNKETILIDKEMLVESSEEKILAKERSQFLTSMLKQLKKEHQLAIILFDLYELSYKECAKRLSISEDAFSSLLQRARRALLEKMLQKTDPNLFTLPLTDNEMKTLASWFDLFEIPVNLEEMVTKKIKSFFNGIGSDFEAFREKTYPKGFDDHLLSLVPLKKRMTVADFGCGTGTIVKKVSPFVSTVFAIDYSVEMIHCLKSSLLQEETTNIVPLCLDVTKDLTEMNHSIHVGFCSMLLHHIFDPKETLKNIAKTIVSGGYLIIADLTYTNKNWQFKESHDFWSGFKQSQLKRWVEEAGFEVVTMKEDDSYLFQFEDVNVPLLTAVCKKV